MKKKVLIVMTTPLGISGISSMVLNYFKYYQQNEFQYEFAVWNDVNDSIRNIILEKNGKLHILPHRLKQPYRYFSALKRLIKENGIDIVHAQGNSSTLYIEMLAAKQAGVRVRIPHSHNSQCKYKVLHYLLKPFFKRSYTHALACSKEAGDWLFGKDYELVRNGIELEKFEFNQSIRDNLRCKLNLEDKKVIGHIAAFVSEKNHVFLLNIFAEIVKMDKSFVLMLVGDGILRDEILAKIKSLNISDNVMIMGRRNDVPELLQVMDIFVLPSLFEGLPFVLVEAQSAGLPCFISDRISKDVALTELVHYISLDVGAKCWAEIIKFNTISNRSITSKKAYENLYKSGYNISTEAKKLENLYSILLKKTMLHS